MGKGVGEGDGPRKAAGFSPAASSHEASDPAYGLTDGKCGAVNISKGPDGKTCFSDQEDGCDHAGDKTAIEDPTGSDEGDERRERTEEIPGIDEHEGDLGTDERCDHDGKSRIKNLDTVHSLFPGAQLRHEKAYKDTQGDKKAIGRNEEGSDFNQLGEHGTWIS